MVMELGLDPQSLLAFCREIPSDTDVVLEAGNEFIGEMLTNYPFYLAKLARSRCRSQVVIKWKGCRRPYEVPAAFADESGSSV
jgi:hypothetical protein